VEDGRVWDTFVALSLLGGAMGATAVDTRRESMARDAVGAGGAPT
jgi:hypothetical protein